MTFHVAIIADSLFQLEVLLYGFVLLWLASVGGCVGSFMNVVVYRLPAKVNIVFPPSRCPNCLHEIGKRDNLPVISWLLLRGRCRICQIRISRRYPAVEALVATIFVSFGAAELFIDQFQRMPSSALMTMTYRDITVGQWGMYFAYELMLCTFVCAALIEHDGYTPPLRLYVPGCVIAVAAAALWPYHRPGFVSLARLTAFDVPVTPALLACADVVLGCLAGIASGLPSVMFGKRRLARQRMCQGALLGAALGWQAVVAAVLITIPMFLLAPRIWPPLRRSPGVWSACWVVSSIAIVLAWRLALLPLS